MNTNLVVDSDGQPLGDEHVAIQIVESLCEQAWHITQVFINGASLFDHKQHFIYNTVL